MFYIILNKDNEKNPWQNWIRLQDSSGKKWHARWSAWIFDQRLWYIIWIFAKNIPITPYNHQSLPYFIDKLKKKRQGAVQQEQARESIQIFLHLYPSENKKAKKYFQIASEKHKIFEEDDAYPAPVSQNKNLALPSNQDRTKTIEQWEKALQV